MKVGMLKSGAVLGCLGVISILSGGCQDPGGDQGPSDDDSAVSRNDATPVSQVAPDTLAAGGAFTAEITMTNTGTTSWSLEEGYYLGSQSPQDNVVWGTNRGWMDAELVVPPGLSYTFALSLTAPLEPGVYTFSWQMLQDGVEWFGTATSQQAITVSGAAASPWETASEDALRAFRGSIATTLAPMPCGPRPDDPTNVVFTAQYDSPCWEAEDRTTAREAHHAHGYTHWAMGPIVQNGYHDWYPDTDWRSDPDGFLDRVEELWNDGFYPVIFLMPDTGLCADGSSIDHSCVESELEPIYAGARFQSLARIVVLAWEPDYVAADWQWGVQWMERVFPAALRYIHFPSGHGAPGRGSELEPDGPYENEAAMWVPVAPSIHGFLMQATWTFGGETDKDRTPLEQFEYDLWDMVRRFQEGYAGWPVTGAGGRAVDVVAFEYASYYCASDGSQGFPEEVAALAIEWGQAALGVSGVAGYGDGGP